MKDFLQVPEHGRNMEGLVGDAGREEAVNM